MLFANNLSPKMYEFATGHWLFKPEATDNIPRDVARLDQMTRRTGQEHDDPALKQYEIRKKQPSVPLITLRRRCVTNLWGLE